MPPNKPMNADKGPDIVGLSEMSPGGGWSPPSLFGMIPSCGVSRQPFAGYWQAVSPSVNLMTDPAPTWPTQSLTSQRSQLRFVRFSIALESDSPVLLLAQCLARLQIVALCLPDVTDDRAPDPGPTPKPLAKESWGKVTPVDGYWDVFDPLSLEPESPVFNSLVDDLSDIYGDLKCGLELYDAGFQFGAAWHWRFASLSHWGEHLVGAQRALYLASLRRVIRTSTTGQSH